MIETNQLKLNVNNIKSTLIRGNKNLKKIRIQEKTLLLKQKKEQQKIQKENSKLSSPPVPTSTQIP